MSSFSIQIASQLLWRQMMFKGINLVPDELNDTVAEGRCSKNRQIMHYICNITLYDENTKNNKISCYHQNALPKMCVPWQ